MDRGARRWRRGLAWAAALAAVPLGLALAPAWEPARPRGYLAEIGPARLALPRALLRDPGAAGGRVARLDLVLPWRGEPGGRPDLRLVLTPADDLPDPALRPAALYARFLDPEVEEDPSGLLARRFARASPYAGEVLLLAGAEGREFSARCPEAGGAAPYCFAMLRQHGLDARVVLPRRALARWEEVVAEVGERLDAWIEAARG